MNISWYYIVFFSGIDLCDCDFDISQKSDFFPMKSLETIEYIGKFHNGVVIVGMICMSWSSCNTHQKQVVFSATARCISVGSPTMATSILGNSDNSPIKLWFPAISSSDGSHYQIILRIFRRIVMGKQGNQRNQGPTRHYCPNRRAFHLRFWAQKSRWYRLSSAEQYRDEN